MKTIHPTSNTRCKHGYENEISNRYNLLKNQGPNLIGLGSKGLQSEIEGGLSAWIKSLFINNLWPSLLSPEESGWRTTITAWLLLLGFGTYMAWGILYCTWVDVGIYAVCVPIIGFGFSLLFLPDDDDNVPQD